MRRGVLFVWLMAAVFGVGGCSSEAPEQVPDDFAGTITYRNGTVAPPYRYEWTLELTNAQGVITWRPGYDETIQPWTTTVPLAPEQRARLYEGLRATGVFDGVSERDDDLAGGPTGSVMLTVAGETYLLSSLGENKESGRVLTALQEVLTTALPAQVWQEFEQKQKTWGQALPN